MCLSCFKRRYLDSVPRWRALYYRRPRVEKKKGKMIIREDDELVCQKSCPLVNDKKSNVRAARAPIREEKEESQEWHGQQQQLLKLETLCWLQESLGHHVVHSWFSLLYISFDVCCSYIITCSNCSRFNSQIFRDLLFLLRQQTTASFIYSPCRPSIPDVVSHHGATCFRFFYFIIYLRRHNCVSMCK